MANASNSTDSSTMNNTLNGTVNPDHPLFLHQTDHPGLLLISKKLTGSDNYSSWKRSMVIALNAKNKMKIVNGEFPEPSTEAPTRELWERNNDMLISWILNTVTEQIGNNLNFINSVSKLWVELHEHYAQIDGHRIYQLTNDIVQLKQSDCSVEVYYHKLKGLWDEFDALEAPYLCVCVCNCANGKENGERDQRKRLVQFLMGLDESYANIRGQILLMQPLPLVVKAYTMVRQEKKQREGLLPRPATTAVFATFGNGQSGQQSDQGYNSGQRSNRTSYTQGEPSERKSNFKKGVICGHCSKEGHYKEHCYRLVGYPVGHPLHGKFPARSQRSQPSYLLALNILFESVGHSYLL